MRKIVLESEPSGHHYFIYWHQKGNYELSKQIE